MLHREKKVVNMFKSFRSKRYYIVILAGILYMLLHNVSFINEDNGFHIIPVNNILKRKLYEINKVDNILNFSMSLENVNDLVNNTKNEIEPKLQEILSDNDNNSNLLKKYESIFSGLNNDEVYKTYELYLSDQNIKSTYNNLKDIEYNKKIKELNDENLNKKELRYIWINIKSNEKNKYFHTIRKIYNMLMHMKIKEKEDNIFRDYLWKNCYSNYLSEEKNVEHLLKEMFNNWSLNDDIKLDEFKIIILGTKLIYRQLLNNVKKQNEEIIIKAFKKRLKEKELRNRKMEEMYKIDFERKNEKMKKQNLNNYLKKRNYYPEMNDKMFINNNKDMTYLNYYLEGNKNGIKYIDSDVDSIESDGHHGKSLLDDKKKEKDIIKKKDGKVRIQYGEDNISDDKSMEIYLKDKDTEEYSSIQEESLDAGETQGEGSVGEVTDEIDDDSPFDYQYYFNTKPPVYEEESDAGETRFVFPYVKQNTGMTKKNNNIRKTLA
ncbi:Plasmodium exported protein (PHISTb), unknown function [Plasmodium sp. DRC-Itaito]|nr:Plasmodium exported protein (PHISTb), unknown function [Plasmodium sp. DRC-Itaito]